MTIRAGRLNSRIEVFQTKDDIDDFGEIADITESIGKVWAEVLHQNSSVLSDTFNQRQSVIKVTIRYSKKIADIPLDRLMLKFNGDDYSVSTLINQRMMNETLILEAIKRG